jgi:hypothetical protein
LLIINRNISHNITWYYDLPTPKYYYLQYLILTGKVFNTKVGNCLSINDTLDFVESREDGYGIYHVEDSFEFLQHSAFHTFFVTNGIDVPRFFRKTRSVRRPINEVNLLKFNNYLMRKGMRYKTLYLLNRKLTLLSNNFPQIKDMVYISPVLWREFFILFTGLNATGSYSQFAFEKDEGLLYGNLQKNFHKDIVTRWDNKGVLFRNLYSLLPVFSFYVYRVDKRIFKNTRGRSGKHTFI